MTPADRPTREIGRLVRQDNNQRSADPWGVRTMGSRPSADVRWAVRLATFLPPLRVDSTCPTCYLRDHRLHCGVCGVATDSNDDFIDLGSLTIVDAVDDTASTSSTSSIAPQVPTHTVPPAAAARWYVVTVGRDVGVFQGWHNVHPLVIGVPGACFTRYSTQTGAEQAFDEAVNEGAVTVVA
ncbi:hypothetical protein BJ138DRAFT_1120968 [Hygrophoropsis aurantiaca]|uniref:Uncharacterized protein n=1 Tax=Hygrophoropsis aurantiaca TaxID=72124 RepID=A0ACB7ZQ50_9AGAM|nr:hypothetical protein BJ138DRAFT_1120968 [Hygrophoropsis aurantiaca]